MTEAEFVASQFQKAFEKYRQDPFVLYGLGKNTEAVLTMTKGFSFVGLMDAQNIGEKRWGLEILSNEMVARIQPRVVIIARESVVPIIYERIASFAKECNLQIYNFKGELLGQKKWTYANRDLPYWNLTLQDLYEQIESHECISFDIFDTLVMRMVLEPKDVFEIAERRICEETGDRIPFKKWRMEAEQALPGYPTIHQIYNKMMSMYDVGKKKAERWKKMEMEVEEAVLVPRRQMIKAYEYALRLGKKVWLISDMYYSAKELEKLLLLCGIQCKEGILVSCECGKGKEDGSLYELYREKVIGKSYLHIGDNRRSDGVKAEEHGLDSFCIYSAYEMWMASSMQRTLANITTIEEKCMLGMILYKCCESPFAFQDTKGFLQVDSMERLGYVFAGGIYDVFIQWLLQEIRRNDVDTLLLPSRDGFFIQRLLEEEKDLDFSYPYFKASRRAVSVAAVMKREDIVALAKREFQGDLGELLCRRFGLEEDVVNKEENQNLKGLETSEIVELVQHYETSILENAKRERGEYLQYIRETIPHIGANVAIFDFVAGGTVQYYLQQLLGKRMKGLYFATMNHPKPEYGLQDSIESCFGNIQSYGADNEVGKHYLFLETLMVDGYPTFEKVRNGKLCYITTEDKKNHFFSEIKKVQDGIIEFHCQLNQLRSLVPKWNAPKVFADSLFGCLFDGSCFVDDKVKKCFYNDDIFDGVTDYQVWKN